MDSLPDGIDPMDQSSDLRPPHPFGRSALTRVEPTNSMSSDDSDEEINDNNNARGLHRSCETARQLLCGRSTGGTAVPGIESELQLESSSYRERNRLNACVSGEMRVAIASLPGGPLGSSIELAQRENEELQMRGEGISTSLTWKGKERMRWDGGPQFPVVQNPRHLLSINGEGKSWSSIPILRNNSTSHPHPDSAQARIARALEELPRQDPHFQPRGPSSVSESRSWLRDIVNRFCAIGYRHISRQHDSFHEQQIAVASEENIPTSHSRAASVSMFERSSRPGCPREAIPPEVFENIARFLPRDSLENMRLVNKEFEFKISRSIFKHVVIPFTPRNFGEQRLQQGPNGLEEGGGRTNFTEMHAFRGFGHHILKFGMSFEVDEAALVNPPIKSSMEVIKTFWGTYRWPYQDYNRYEAVEGLENFADDTRKMKAAFSTLGGVIELGISLDNGLGWLNGPDVPPRATIFKSKPSIFGPSNTLPDARKRDQIENWRALLLAAQTAPADARHSLTAGEPSNPDIDNEKLIDGVLSRVFDQLYPGRATVVGYTRPAAGPCLFRETTPIMPNCLTMAQREWLLETDWAQRAFLNSYCLAVIDNHMSFQNLRSFNIARLPSHYLSLLCRTDFWSSIGNVTALFLGIIPEWHEIAKLQTENVETRDVLPSKAVGRAYDFLQGWVGPNPSIKTLTFGWVGGGERAPGMYARSKNVMAAPLFMAASDMLKLTGKESAQLLLPHVENLTLSNCWISPAALTSFANAMGELNLKTLKLDSVSLSSGPSGGRPLVLQPLLGHRPSWADGPFGPHPPGLVTVTNAARERVQVPPPWPPIPEFESPAGYKWLGPPRPGSWVDVIEDISPGITLAALRHRFGLTDQPPEPRTSRIQHIEFESCGYVILPGYSFDQRVVGIPKPWRRLSDHLSCRMKLLEGVMMSTNDTHLGVITPYLSMHDREKLQGAWGMEEGWADDSAAAENTEDGQLLGGTGRFRGVIDANDPCWGIQAENA